MLGLPVAIWRDSRNNKRWDFVLWVRTLKALLAKEAKRELLGHGYLQQWLIVTISESVIMEFLLLPVLLCDLSLICFLTMMSSTRL